MTHCANIATKLWCPKDLPQSTRYSFGRAAYICLLALTNNTPFQKFTPELFFFRKMIKFPLSLSKYPVCQWASVVGLSNAVVLALTEAGMAI